MKYPNRTATNTPAPIGTASTSGDATNRVSKSDKEKENTIIFYAASVLNFREYRQQDLNLH
jgi:hypothetical protein